MVSLLQLNRLELKDMISDEIAQNPVLEESMDGTEELSPEEFARVAQRVQSLQQLRADVHAGFEAIESGDYEDFDERTTKTLAYVIKGRGRLRLADRSNA